MKPIIALTTLCLSIMLVACDSDSKPKPPVTKQPIGKGVLPPAYLTIKDVKPCLGTKKMGTWDAVCIPANKPAQCNDDSWGSLQKLKGADRPDNCK